MSGEEDPVLAVLDDAGKRVAQNRGLTRPTDVFQFDCLPTSWLDTSVELQQPCRPAMQALALIWLVFPDKYTDIISFLESPASNRAPGVGFSLPGSVCKLHHVT